ncbi:MAG: recombinase [Proteobacteria bacterium]|nr:recombinase [Pseudomonadota bacterium]
MIKSAVVYCRVSSSKQVKEGHGLESQETRCREYARLKSYEVVEVFRDEGISGGMIDRPKMQEMLAFLRKNKKEQHAVIIDDISRLARGLEAHLELRSAIAEAGGKLESPSIEFGEDSDSRLVEHLLASVSQHQRQKNAEQVKNRMRARTMGGYCVIAPSIGYRYKNVAEHGKMLVRDEPIASILQEALEGFAHGRFETKTEVKRFLDSQEAFPKNCNGEVHFQRIDNILRRVIYAGYIHMPEWGIHYLKAKHEALISFEAWQKIQERLDGKAKTPTRKDIRCDFPLRGFILCDHCGKPMTSCWSKGRNGKYPYYFCDTKGCPLSRKSIRKEKIEADFLALLEGLRPSATLILIAKEMFRDCWEARNRDKKGEILARKAELQALEHKEAQLFDRIVEADNPSLIAAYENRIKELGLQKIVLKEKIEANGGVQQSFNEIYRTAFEFLKNPQKLWVSGDLFAQRTVLKLTFEEKLKYSKIEGFRTALTTCPFRLFREFAPPKYEMVTPAGLEPAAL